MAGQLLWEPYVPISILIVVLSPLHLLASVVITPRLNRCEEGVAGCGKTLARLSSKESAVPDSAVLCPTVTGSDSTTDRSSGGLRPSEKALIQQAGQTVSGSARSPRRRLAEEIPAEENAAALPSMQSALGSSDTSHCPGDLLASPVSMPSQEVIPLLAPVTEGAASLIRGVAQRTASGRSDSEQFEGGRQGAEEEGSYRRGAPSWRSSLHSLELEENSEVMTSQCRNRLFGAVAAACGIAWLAAFSLLLYWCTPRHEAATCMVASLYVGFVFLMVTVASVPRRHRCRRALNGVLAGYSVALIVVSGSLWSSGMDDPHFWYQLLAPCMAVIAGAKRAW